MRCAQNGNPIGRAARGRNSRSRLRISEQIIWSATAERRHRDDQTIEQFGHLRRRQKRDSTGLLSCDSVYHTCQAPHLRPIGCRRRVEPCEIHGATIWADILEEPAIGHAQICAILQTLDIRLQRECKTTCFEIRIGDISKDTGIARIRADFARDSSICVQPYADQIF